MSKIRVVVCRVFSAPVVAEIDGGLASFQAIVGGNIECVDCGDGLDLWCNEEGRVTSAGYRDIPMRAAPQPEGYDFVIEARGPDDPPFALPGEMGYHRIYGDFFFARADEEGNTTSILSEDLPRIAELLGQAVQ